MHNLVMPLLLVLLLLILRRVIRTAPAPKNTTEQRRGNW